MLLQLLPSFLLLLLLDVQLIVDYVEIRVVHQIIAIISKYNAEIEQYNSTMNRLAAPFMFLTLIPVCKAGSN